MAMNQGPYGYGMPGAPMGMGGGPDAASRVALPSMLMLVLSGVTALLNMVGIAMNILGSLGSVVGAGGSEQVGVAIFSGGISVVMGVVSILFNLFVIFGSLKMRKLESHTLALVAAVLFSLPCSLCCLLNTPIGIWAIVVLLDNNVRPAFRS